MIKLELKVLAIGALPVINSHCLAFITLRWKLGYWRYFRGELTFDAEDGTYYLLEEVSAWVELPENLKEIE